MLALAVLPVAAGTGALLLLCLRLTTLFTAAFAVTMIVAGGAMYYGGSDTALWLCPIAVLGLFARDVAQSVAGGGRARLLRKSHLIALAIFFVWAAFVSVLKGISASQLLVAFKNYGAMWLVILPVARLATLPRFPDRLELLLVGLLVLQLPFVIQQAATAGSWDGVVGTFGGDPDGGGLSGVLMLFTAVGVVVTVDLWQRGRISTLLAAPALVSALAIASLAEIKAVFVFLPLALAVQQRRRIRQAPAQTAALALLMMLGIYASFGIQSARHSGTDRGETIQASIGYFFDPAYVSYETGEVSRGASIGLWAQYGGDAADRALGHGAGASRVESTVSAGSLATRFRGLNINATTTAQLLWDFGVVGLLLFAAVFVVAFGMALRLARAAAPADRSRADTLAALLAMAFPLFIYDRSLVDVPMVQFLYGTLFGLLANIRVRAAAPMRGQ